MFGESDSSMPADITSLTDLLRESSEAAKIRNQETQPPAATVPTKIVTSSSIFASQTEKKIEALKDPLAIWSDSEIMNEEDLVDQYDKRPAPRYEFFFKQLVGSEDIFLGLSDKSPAVQDCTHLVVKIHFPGATMRDLDLDVTKNRIKASSAKFKLFTYFPVSVDNDKGSAKFDSKKEVLVVTFPIIHE